MQQNSSSTSSIIGSSSKNSPFDRISDAVKQFACNIEKIFILQELTYTHSDYPVQKVKDKAEMLKYAKPLTKGRSAPEQNGKITAGRLIQISLNNQCIALIVAKSFVTKEEVCRKGFTLVQLQETRSSSKKNKKRQYA